jgi:hypothetical protein
VGTVLGTIHWDDGNDEKIVSPVAGTVAAVNHNVADGQLDQAPSQLALSLS